MKKLIILLSAMLLWGCAPKAADTPDEAAVTADTSLNISVLGDISMQPHMEEEALNRKALSFVYEPLFYTDSSMNPVPVLAENIEVTDTGILVYIKNGVRFHDGAALTAEDAACSANLVAEGRSSYVNEGIVSARAVSDTCMEVILTHSMPQPEKLLAFPIVKKGSESLSVPVGTGPYMYVEKEGYDTLKFAQNPDYHSEKPDFTELTMISARTQAAVDSLYQVGETDIYYGTDLSLMPSRTNAKIIEYITDKMVFIGFNNARVPHNVRRGIYHGIDRYELTEKCFGKSAVYSNLPLSPVWSTIDKTKNINPYNPMLAEADLGGGGYTLDFLVQRDSGYEKVFREISSILSAYGITCTMTETDEYYQRLGRGDYEACIGEYKADTDLHAILGDGNPFVYKNDELINLAASKSTVNAALDIFMEDVPIIPVCFKKGAVSYCAKLDGVIEGTD